MAALDADIEKRLAEVIPVYSSQYCSPRPHTAPAVEVLREALEELKLENKGTVKIGNVVSEVGGNAGRGGTAREEVQDEDGKASDEKKTGEELPKRGKDQYPQRSGEPDCGYFIKTGKCAFGKNCKFNHPSEGRKIQVQNPHSQDTSQILEESVREFEVKKIEEELPVKVGKLKCKYFGTPGGCKYGDACRYGHFLDKSEEKVELNFLGLPVRPAEKECQFYMRTGSCKFSANCRYHHPNPTVTGGNDPASWHHQIAKDGSVLFADSSHSYMPQMPMMTQLHANHVWDICQAPNDPFLDGMPMHHPFGPRAAVAANGSENQPPVTPSSMITDSSNGSNSRQSVQIADLPQRPGQPECPYYLRKGGCKYKSCKFHHPKDPLTDQSSCVLTPSGLPLRPGQSICTHYSRYGICKLGPACSFDHPTNGIPS